MVTLKATFSDPHAEGSGALGPDGIAGTGDEGYGNDYVDGTITLNGRTLHQMQVVQDSVFQHQQ